MLLRDYFVPRIEKLLYIHKPRRIFYILLFFSLLYLIHWWISLLSNKKEKKGNVPGVTKRTTPRSRILVATSAIHRKSLRHHRSRCLLPLTPFSFSAAVSIGLPTKSRRFPNSEPITPDPPFEHLEPFSCPFSSFACRLHAREPVHVG